MISHNNYLMVNLNLLKTSTVEQKTKANVFLTSQSLGLHAPIDRALINSFY